MKKTSSLVWRFFDRLEENKRCTAVLCKLCDTQYKYFGNTTNLRTHLVNKHPIQWDLLQNGTLDESTFRALDDDDNTNQSTISTPRQKRRKYVKNYKNDNVDVLENSDHDNDNVDENEILVRQMHNRGSDEEWLEEEVYPNIDSYEPKRKKVKVKHIKREIQSPPPRRSSNYIFQSPKTYPKPERIVIDNSSKRDEYSVFGDYVANKLRKFKGPQTKGNIQQLITTILWQAEYGMYDNMESVKRIILHSVQEMVTEEQPQETEPLHSSHVDETQVQVVIDNTHHRNNSHMKDETVTIIDAPGE
ncbi:uncharacterized protein [Epargyreus clarus]|uniref:uncharacterized protein isoform X2 n=1 Tax=Epargyreus clarus TaxID=520877 RepID=UPI003C2CC5DE